MKDLIKNIGGLVDKADNLYQDDQERDLILNDRHKIDMQSDSKLSKMVRPLTVLVLLFLQVVIALFSMFGYHAHEIIVIEHGVLLSGALGFYFNSRKAEKTARENAQANIEIEKIKTRHEIKQERKESRHERKRD